MARELSEQQQKFLEVLFEAADGDFRKAMQMAGYSNTYPVSALAKVLEEEIVSATKLFLARNGPKAAQRLVGILDNPLQLGAKELLATSKDLLDRIGLAKTETVKVEGSGVFILPAKRVEDESSS